MIQSNSIADRTVVVILAAGKGTRMGNENLPKVCFDIDGIPAINRTIQTFKSKKFIKFIVVVGSRAEVVMKSLGRDDPDIFYVYQHQPQGTGQAARIAANALQNTGFDGNVLVTLGDKFLETQTIDLLTTEFIKKQADLAFASIPKTKTTRNSGGRIFLDHTGQVIDIIEVSELKKQTIADILNVEIKAGKKITPESLKHLMNQHIHRQEKQKIILPELFQLSNRKLISIKDIKEVLKLKQYNMEIQGKFYTSNEIENRCKGVNPSLYLFKSDAFYTGVAKITNDNAQNEYYLTDVVRHLAKIKNIEGDSIYKIRTVDIENTEWIQGFNSPDELLIIQDYLRKKRQDKNKITKVPAKPQLKTNQYDTVDNWLKKIKNHSSSLNRWMTKIYGENPSLHMEKCNDLRKLLVCYGKKFGVEQKVCIIRAPGRINLMGRHVDHRGGFNNFLAIDRETFAVAGIRNDDNVIAVNLDPHNFKQLEFNISEMIGNFGWSDWENFVNSNWVTNILITTAGQWGNYIKAAMLRLQHQYHDVRVRGLNLAISGNVPIAAGLSSSSTLVVATLQAAIALNNFELTSRQFIDLCGQGEWFVGSRGGAGDHAAIYLGQRGKIANVSYYPFSVNRIIDAPKDYQVILANSHIQAKKSGGAKDTFNQKITSYNLGLELLKHRCPELRDKVQYVRDLEPNKLGISISEFYEMMKKIPQYMTRKDFKSLLPAICESIVEKNFATHSDPGKYNVRGVMIFGVSEICRSRICIELLENEQIESFGTLMKVSHNGDRISILKDGKYCQMEDPYTDDYLNTLMSDLASEDPQRVIKGQLYMQPGSYACSTEEIDRMVDIVCAVDGVAGAQIAGAGLGGCIMILAKKTAIQSLTKALIKDYYKPNKLAPLIIPCIVVEGAGLAQF